MDKTQPNEVYLQHDPENTGEPFAEAHEVTWAKEPVFNTDLRFIRPPRWIARPQHNLFIRSMGKLLRIMAVFCDVDEANRYMARHDNAAVVAELGPFILLADKHDKGIG